MACLSFLKNIIPGISNTLICKVLNIRLELSEGFLVLRVKDNTKTNILFRKFQLSCVKQEIIDNSVQIDVWQTSSHQVDILVKCTADGVVPYLKEGATVCLNGVECRAVPLGSTNVVHELYLNNESGNKLRVIPCDDFKFSVQERLDNALYIDGRAFLGTIELIKIRNGLCFYLLCEVMKVSREESTGHMVMRVRDATKIRIATKKYDVDNHSQSDKEESFDINSNAVDILVTSPPQNLSDLC
ncbi:hypothetical protein O3P69_010811 [Scylla paramamosain]|uniref:Uncharacterized protein n=1 Tax=Scylla paramamosain TaxID=85552 RepID=A0AAW0TH00_SCYPA